MTKCIITVCLLFAFNGFAQNSQSEFDFLMGKNRTDSIVKDYLTLYFSLSDEEYDGMWTQTNKKNNHWKFSKIADVDANTYEFPLLIRVNSGKISVINVFGKDMMSATGWEKWTEFYGATLPGGFRFDMTTSDMKRNFDNWRFKPSKKAPWAMKKRTGQLIGFKTKLPNAVRLDIHGTGKRKKPVRILVYK